jgi:hypothetical protein
MSPGTCRLGRDAVLDGAGAECLCPLKSCDKTQLAELPQGSWQDVALSILLHYGCGRLKPKIFCPYLEGRLIIDRIIWHDIVPRLDITGIGEDGSQVD